MRRAVFAVVLLAAGCAGGGDALSREEYLTRANAICRDYHARINRVPRADTEAGFVRYLDRTLPLAREQVDKIAELEPPEDMQAEVDKMLADVRSLYALAGELREATKERQRNRVADIIERSNQVGARADSRARAIGLRDCAA